MNQAYLELIVALVTGICTAIPLVIKLVEYVRKSVEEKNWNNLVTLTLKYMQQAERSFENGDDKKAWVMGMVQTTAQSVNYQLDDESLAKLSTLIDSICDASKVINVAPTEGGE